MKKIDLWEFDQETQRLQNEIDAHLSKFDNVDDLLNIASDLVQEYFDLDLEHSTIHEYKIYLKWQIKIYTDSFSMSRSEKKLIREELLFIEESFSKLLHYWEEPESADISNEVKNEKNSFTNKVLKIIKK
jgi:hypothetical protein